MVAIVEVKCVDEVVPLTLMDKFAFYYITGFCYMITFFI